MPRLKRILIATVAILLLLLVIGLLLPSAWQVERSVVIRAPAATIFPHLNSLKRWRDWAVWYQRNPNTQIEYSGADAGVGTTSRWRDENGRVTMKVMESERDRLVAYVLLLNSGEFRSEGVLLLMPEGAGTRVIWRAAGEVGRNPANRYFALLQRYSIGNEFAVSLESLKLMLETKS